MSEEQLLIPGLPFVLGKLAGEEAVLWMVLFLNAHGTKGNANLGLFCWLQQTLEWSLEQTEH